MEQHRGMHAMYAGRRCVECHKEHHGRKFDIVHFDERAFDHTQTGFALEGTHARLECARCHRRELIRDAGLLSGARGAGARTFLGLGRECAACHRDVHRGQPGAACSDCHSAEAWKPAPRFSHERARFKLAGAHAKAACERCHPKTSDGTFPFRVASFSSCRDCHSDPHRGKFSQPCEQCHSVQGWKEGARRQFSHAATRFPLLGKHAAVACGRCHSAKQFHVERFGRCADCHVDAHKGQFSSRKDQGACESCHTTDGFSPSTFSPGAHQATRFPLDGAHSALPCPRCHRPDGARGTAARYRWDKPSDCRSCHADVHKGSFAAVMASGCTTCHTTARWGRVSFAHDSTRFPLTGAHASLSCARCHLVDGLRVPVETVSLSPGTGPRRALRQEGPMTCTLCHRDPHNGQFQARYGGRCEPCHTTRRWAELVFTHDSTAFALTGAHARVACAGCHAATDPASPSSPRRFAGTPKTCAGCHGATGTR